MPEIIGKTRAQVSLEVMLLLTVVVLLSLGIFSYYLPIKEGTTALEVLKVELMRQVDRMERQFVIEKIEHKIEAGVLHLCVFSAPAGLVLDKDKIKAKISEATSFGPENIAIYVNDQTGICSGIAACSGDCGSIMLGNKLLMHMDYDWLDSSGNSNDGTGQGGIAFTSASKFGSGAGSFDGVNDYVSVQDSPELQLGTEQTIAVWFDATSFPADFDRLVGKSSLSQPIQRNYGLWIDKDGKTLYQICDAGGCCNIWGGSVAANSGWHFLVGTRTGNTMRIYLDGDQQGDIPLECNLAPPVSNDPLMIGYHKVAAANRYFKGKIDEAAVWSRALSSSEISELYHRECACE